MRTASRLGAVAELKLGFAFPSENFSTDAEHPKVLRGDNIGQGSLRWDQGHTATWPGETPPTLRLKPGDVAIAMDRPWVANGLKFASIGASDGVVLLGQRVAVLRALPGFPQRFLHYVVADPRFTTYVRGIQTGTGIPHISGSQIKDYSFSPPEPSEQQAIAEVLGALDDKIAANRALCSTIEELSESLYRRAVGNAGDTAPFGNFLKFSYGKALKSEDRVPGDVKVVGSGGVTGWHDRALVDHSGIVVGRKGSMGSVHWVDGPHFPIDTAYSVENLTPLPDAFWLFALAKAGFPSMNSDSAVPGLNRDRALAVHTPVPLDTSEFNAVVPPLFEARAATQRESDSLSSLRDTLLPALMDGTIRVKDAEKAVSDVM